ncbi:MULTISPECIES: ATP-dependent DNA helicase [unclassified Crossiella]|uniref:ATP-dependent helicase n=1 Tax=unclassified Crossiella TaxID=2620835 RepID=UPI001FFF386B|nr:MULTISPECIES: ATP-dependent DNA helicase [unclassified Crossiella]MCK2237322.1 UvrD-helicase domain-containing protein [Crossiella sp. S99.2]MCK2250977.1 UvrD-helicase domain-containing protein [Crossiella sp. S99.1]
MTEFATPHEVAAALGLHPPTPEQAEVIAAPAEPALVIAGAGAGKTETMAARVVWLVANGLVTPERVLGLTFTRKAARQLGDRVRARLRRLAGSGLLDRLDPSGDRRAAVTAGEPTVLTYHAYAGRLVGEHGLRLPVEPGARLLTETAAWQLAHRVVAGWTEDIDTDKVPATVTQYLLSLAGELGEHLVSPDQLRAHALEFCRLIEDAPRAPRQREGLPVALQEIVAAQRLRVALLPLVEAYAKRKRREAAMDFADQMSLAASLAETDPDVVAIERERYGAVLLDEYQDTGHAQRVLLRGLFGGSHRPVLPVTSVGDPVQAIYGWRGASAANLPRFATDFPTRDQRGKWVPATTYGLLTSFRNPPEVLTLANQVSAQLRSGVAELRAKDNAGVGDVRIALLPDLHAELAWLADTVAARWESTVDATGAPPTAAVLVRRRADMAGIAAALRERGLPVEVVGLGGLLNEPEVRDLVSALRMLTDPLAGTAAMRLLTGARWRLGVADLAALWRRARLLATPEGKRGGPDPLDALADALPGEHAEQAGLVDALDDPGPPEEYSPEGFRRIRRLGGELAALRRRGDQPLGELVADVERTLLLDIESLSRLSGVGRAHLDAFADVVAEFARSSANPTLNGLLDYLATAERAEDGLEPGEVEVSPDRVQILTAHAAKGLEWHVVAVPHLVKDVFPGRRKSASWLRVPHQLPAVLRGDAQDLPGLNLHSCENRKEIEEALAVHSEEFEERRLAEERRLLYVALTRSEETLLVSGHWWGETGEKPRGPSEFLTEIHEVITAGDRVGIVHHWAPHPEEDEVNPLAAQGNSLTWPVDPLARRRSAVTDGADLVREALSTVDQYQSPVEPEPADEDAPEPGNYLARDEEYLPPEDDYLPPEEDFVPPEDDEYPPEDPYFDEPEPEPSAEAEAVAEPAPAPDAADAPEPAPANEFDPEGWARDVDVLLAERAAAANRREQVLLPEQLSVSQLVELAKDPDALARRLRRPLPFPPNPLARRGTAFHAWLEHRYQASRLLDFDELPGAADADLPTEENVDALQRAFLASTWAERTPHDVEVPFETEVDGITVRGRMDAVFTDPDGGWTVVDWKTGAVPDEAHLPALAVQLAAYRLAWAALAGADLATVRAAFHYVRTDTTLRPADLLDAEGLRELVRGIPKL